MSSITVNPLPDAIKATGSGFYRMTRLVTAKEIIQAAKALVSRRCRLDISLADPEVIKDYFLMQLASAEHDVFAVAFLGQGRRIFAFEILNHNKFDCSGLQVAVVARRALELNAMSVILAHTHPPGHPEPSEVDKYLTTLCHEGLRLFNIAMLDHFVISGSQVMSFSECGLL